MLLNNRFVVPVGVPVDNVNTFATLQAALTTATVNAGDVIQIEPGSSPGNIVNADLPAVANLTIQGDPGVAASAIPQFTISDALVVAQAGFTLRNVNVGLVGAGSLSLNANATITSSLVADVSSSALLPMVVSGTVDNLLNSTFVDNSSTSATAFISISPGVAGTSNLIAGNTFVLNTPATALLQYSAAAAATLRDQVSNNTFLAQPGSSPTFLLQVAGPISGLTIQDNTFSSADIGTRAIAVSSSVAGLGSVTIAGNTVNLTATAPGVVGGPNTVGILITTSTAGVSLNTVIHGNLLNTVGLGSGLRFDIGNTGSVVSARVEGNDLHNNKIGVFINSTAGAALVSSIDLGGGNQSSLGGNNFRSYTAAASATSGAIVTNALAVQGGITARSNIFANGVNPESVTFDSSENATLTDVDESSPLTGNAAFVETLYIDFLKRAGNTTSSTDAGAWVTALNNHTLTQTGVANSIIRSTEALGLLLDGLYVKVLNRLPDVGGRNSFINLLQNGGTIEQVINTMVTAPEFNVLTGTDSGFVQGLYSRLLGRVGSNAEIAGWVSQLPTLGRSGVANAILKSAEFRTDVVRQFYGFSPAALSSVASLFPPLLHRTTAPTAAELNGWVNSTSDLLTIEVTIAGTGEFFTNG
ncbi:MAG TPA: hypothetical protein VGY66_09155 [Gemmataceae bacterium]|jgi:hypothetical protein|nr:hypothetical protein [Gemmataceae bacterium]